MGRAMSIRRVFFRCGIPAQWKRGEQLVKYLAYHPFESELTVIAEECDVNIVAHAHQPE